MTDQKNREWHVLRQPIGAPNRDRDMELKELSLPKQLEDGTFLVRNCWMSLDPYMRGTMNPTAYGRKLPYPRKMTGGSVGQVVESKHPSFPVGVLVAGQFGWCDFAVSNGNGSRIVPNDWKPSWALGVLGMPGATAYYGLLDIIGPKKGETIVVSSCTGAVGMLVGQIAKIFGAKTIGFTSTPKLDFAKRFGYDHVIDYKGKDVKTLIGELQKVAPDGVNGYFDNTGGPCTEATLQCLTTYGRVSVCGQIAYYNLEDPMSAKTYPMTYLALRKQLKIEGFICTSLPKKDPGNWKAGHLKMAEWLKNGDIKISEDITEGLENAFDAFLSLFHGVGDLNQKSNFGKKLVHISDAPLSSVETKTRMS